MEGALVIGPGPGRGAWIHPDDPRCLDLAERHGGFGWALRSPIAAGAFEALRAALSGR